MQYDLTLLLRNNIVRMKRAEISRSNYYLLIKGIFIVKQLTLGPEGPGGPGGPSDPSSPWDKVKMHLSKRC